MSWWWRSSILLSRALCGPVGHSIYLRKPAVMDYCRLIVSQSRLGFLIECAEIKHLPPASTSRAWDANI